MSATASRLARLTRQALLAPHSLVGGLGWTAAAVAVPTLLRLAIDGGRSGVPFVTYFPAIVLAALFLGWRCGALAAAVSAGVARLLFMEAEPWLVESPEGLAVLGLFVLSCVLLVSIGAALRRAFFELQAVSAREALLNEELRHRLKNLLAVVGSLAALSHRHADPEQAHAAFVERLAALNRATDLLGLESHVPCALPELAEEALQPFLGGYDILLEGAPETIHRDCCVPAVLAFHELATNAIKYGALSVPGGRVNVRWSDEGEGQVRLRWREHDGPHVAAPTRRGLGSRILSMRSPAASFAIEFVRDGVCCDMLLKKA